MINKSKIKNFIKKYFTKVDKKDIRNQIIAALLVSLILFICACILASFYFFTPTIQSPKIIFPDVITNDFEDFNLSYQFMNITSDEYKSDISIKFTIVAKAHMSKVGFSYNKSDNITNVILDKDGYEREDNDNLEINMKAYPKLIIGVPKDTPREDKWMQLAIYFQNKDGNTVIGESKKIFLNLKKLIVSNETFFFINTDEDGILDIFYNSKNNINTQIIFDDGRYFFDSNGDGKLDYIYDPVGGGVYKPAEGKGFPLIYILILLIIIVIILIIAVLFKTGYIYLEEESKKKKKR